jgi:hypothetical protein
LKGLGITLQKPLKNWYSVGMGLRIPLTAHFPEYDRYVSLPRLSMTLVGYWPYDCKVGFSCSFPVTQVMYAMVTIGSQAGLSTDRLSERLRRIKASDSIKRVGVNFSVYYNQESGLRTSMGMSLRPCYVVVTSCIIVTSSPPHAPSPSTILTNTNFSYLFVQTLRAIKQALGASTCPPGE